MRGNNAALTGGLIYSPRVAPVADTGRPLSAQFIPLPVQFYRLTISDFVSVCGCSAASPIGELS
jgi:hypothetical protein